MFTYRKAFTDPDGWRVGGHPEHPGFDFATIVKTSSGRYVIHNQAVGLRCELEFDTRDEAAIRALQADRQSRAQHLAHRTRQVPMTIALLNRIAGLLDRWEHVEDVVMDGDLIAITFCTTHGNLTTSRFTTEGKVVPRGI